MEGKNFELENNHLSNKQHLNQDGLEFLLKQYGIENVPHIETHFFFHKHATTEDGNMVAERLKNADVLIQENAGWDVNRLKIFNDVSDGTLTPDQAITIAEKSGKPFLWKDFYHSLLNGLYKSEKKVVLVDVPDNNVIFKNLMGLYASHGAYNNLIDKSLSYEETLRRVGNVSKFESDMQKAREDYILENIPQVLSEMLKNNNELQDKETVNILFSMGGFHTRLYHEMKNGGNNVQREFSTMPYNFDPRITAERSIHFNGMNASQDWLPKITLYLILTKEFPDIEITHDVVSAFSQEEIKNIYEQYQTSSTDEFRSYIEGIL